MNLHPLTFPQIQSLFPPRNPDSHKGSFGTLLCITGSANMPGACAISALAALRSGTGLVKIATAAQNLPILASRIYEPVYLPLQTDAAGFLTWNENAEALTTAMHTASAILIGCGLGVTPGTCALVENVLHTAKCPVVVDADGLNCLPYCIDIEKVQNADWIFTPHPGEMARLAHKTTAMVQAERMETAVAFCKKFPGVLVLKGAGTLICQGNHMVQNPTGNPGMSRGGSGDMLAGMIAAFVAQHMDVYEAACAGAYLHGLAGDIAAKKYAQQAMLPTDMIQCLQDVFLKIEQER